MEISSSSQDEITPPATGAAASDHKKRSQKSTGECFVGGLCMGLPGFALQGKGGPSWAEQRLARGGARSRIRYVEGILDIYAEDVRELLEMCFTEEYLTSLDSFFEEHFDAPCILAVQRSTVVGAIVYPLERDSEGNLYAYIAYVAVDENFRRNRIGFTLVSEAIQALTAMGATKAVLHTQVHNVASQRLYAELGFVVTRRIPNYYSPEVDGLEMTRILR